VKRVEDEETEGREKQRKKTRRASISGSCFAGFCRASREGTGISRFSVTGEDMLRNGRLEVAVEGLERKKRTSELSSNFPPFTPHFESSLDSEKKEKDVCDMRLDWEPAKVLEKCKRG